MSEAAAEVDEVEWAVRGEMSGDFVAAVAVGVEEEDPFERARRRRPRR